MSAIFLVVGFDSECRLLSFRPWSAVSAAVLWRILVPEFAGQRSLARQSNRYRKVVKYGALRIE